MKKSKIANTHEMSWKWPINLATYNRTIILSLIENKHIKILVKRFEAGGKGWHNEARVSLKRLLLPLYDVLDKIGTVNSIKRKYTIRTTVICILIRAMHRHGQSYWGFSTEIWYELLGIDYYAYVKQHGVTANARQQLIAVAYLLCGFNELSKLGRLSSHVLASKIFGEQEINTSITKVLTQLNTWGYTQNGNVSAVRCALSEILLAQRSPRLEELTIEKLKKHYLAAQAKITRRGLLLVSYALVHMNITTRSLGRSDWINLKEGIKHRLAAENVAPEWLNLCERWYMTSTLQPGTRVSLLYRLLQTGRWFEQTYPLLKYLSDWTRQICSEYVAAVDRGKVGQWSNPTGRIAKDIGKPFSPKTKEGLLRAMRTFTTDAQEWGWIPRRFNPARDLATPRSIRALIGPSPRIITDEVWAKLVWAGLNLTDDDLLKENRKSGRDNWKFYPPAMIRALAIVWLFSGLRRNEILRLRLGCIRWQETKENKSSHGTDENKICLLDVPVNKTSTAFTKPVDKILGKTVNLWEAKRPPQPAWLDPKTGEKVQLLFSYRGQRIGITYLNKTLIPLLCHKAGVPLKDARGSITSHRARATIASQLYNAKEPLTLFELQDWLGHRSPESTRHYTQISPTVLAKSYTDAGYFARNVRAIEVLIDKEAVEKGTAGKEPWKHYDLGHGYCSYDFFEQCPHRMACARCDFYVPKQSSKAQLLEGKDNLLRLRQDIPLTETETAAVDGDLSAYEKLINQLESIPTPSGTKNISQTKTNKGKLK